MQPPETTAAVRIAVIGLGYVGLPLAIALARHFPAVGVDIDVRRIDALRARRDWTHEIDRESLARTSLTLSCDIETARGAHIIIVTVPTPVDDTNQPDLRPLLAASRSLASILERGAGTIIVFESTVYPGVTEEICGPEIERISGLERGTDFFLGYSPERINPGDREHRIDRITKVVAGENDAVAATLERVYGAMTSGGIFRAASIKAAEAAKVIENAQRDINIAFINEITQIFSKLGLSIHDVLDAAGTKWNFLKFQPGLVGGHCIGVDPYYLSNLAVRVGQFPRVVLAGRSINDGMGAWIADRVHEQLGGRASILVLGLTFKENVPDIRNSRVVDVVRRLEWLGHDVAVHDPLADPAEAFREYGIRPITRDEWDRYDALVGAVPHTGYAAMDPQELAGHLHPGGLLADLKGIWRSREVPTDMRYWSL